MWARMYLCPFCKMWTYHGWFFCPKRPADIEEAIAADRRPPTDRERDDG